MIVTVIVLCITSIIMGITLILAGLNTARVEKRVTRCEKELATMRRHPCNHPAGSRPRGPEATGHTEEAGRG
jgi:hypothetical protein